MAKERVIKGLDTIHLPAVTIPQDNRLDTTAIHLMEQIKDALNRTGLALIPYCGTCSQPLDWVYEPEPMLRCPACGRTWRHGVILDPVRLN